jgi:MFS family permease
VAHALNLSEREIGMVFGSVALGAAPAMLMANRWLTRHGWRTAGLAGAVFLITLSLPLYAPSYTVLLLFAFCMGAAYGVLDLTMNIAASVMERERGAPVMSSMHGFFNLGIFSGASLTSGFLAFGMGSRLSLFLASATLCLPLAYSMGPADLVLGPTESNENPPVRAILQATLSTIGGLVCLAMFLEGAVENWVVVLLVQRGMSVSRAASVLAVYAVCCATARFLGDHLVHRWGRRALFAVSGLSATAGLCLGLMSGADIAVYAAYSIAGLGTGNLVPLLFSEAASASRSAAAGITGVTIAGYVSLLLGPPAVGLIAFRIGIVHTLAALATIGLVCALAATTKAFRGNPVTEVSVRGGLG